MKINKKSCKVVVVFFLIIFIMMNLSYSDAATNKKKTTKTTTKTTSTTNTKSEEPKETHTVNSKDRSISNYYNTLKSLSVEGYEIYPEFNKNTTDYYVSIPKDVTNLFVNASPEYDTAKCVVTGNTNLTSKKENLIKVTVTSEKKVSKVYNIHVNWINNSGLSLQMLSIEGTALSPSFDKDTYYYTAEIFENEISPLTIKAIANKSTAKVEIIGNDDSLVKGDNLISIVVEDDGDMAVYQIELTIKEKILTTVTQGGQNNKIVELAKQAKDFIFKSKRNLIAFLAIIFIIIIILVIAVIRKMINNKKDKKRQKLKNRAI